MASPNAPCMDYLRLKLMVNVVVTIPIPWRIWVKETAQPLRISEFVIDLSSAKAAVKVTTKTEPGKAGVPLPTRSKHSKHINKHMGAIDRFDRLDNN